MGSAFHRAAPASYTPARLEDQSVLRELHWAVVVAMIFVRVM
jgi:hypothetical protein